MMEGEQLVASASLIVLSTLRKKTKKKEKNMGKDVVVSEEGGKEYV